MARALGPELLAALFEATPEGHLSRWRGGGCDDSCGGRRAGASAAGCSGSDKRGGGGCFTDDALRAELLAGLEWEALKGELAAERAERRWRARALR
jgi:hypothetical protein